MSGNPLFVWDQDPLLFSIGSLSIRWYGLLFASGFAIGFMIMRSIFRRENKPEQDLETLLTYLVLGTIAGARLGHCLFYEPELYLSNPIEILKVWKGGLASHGGVIGVMCAIFLYSRSRPDQSFLWICDRIAFPTALVAAMIRLGNLFNSEIYGHPSDVFWSVTFARIDAQPRHPTQLYECFAYVVVFFVMRFVYGKFGAKLPRGLNLGLFLVLVFGARFFIEYAKVRQANYGEDSVLSVGQWLSLPFLFLGLILIARARRQSPEIHVAK